MALMAYQVYFADLTEENRGLVLAILKLKEEADTLEPGEAEVLYELRGSTTPAPIPPEENAQQRQRDGVGQKLEVSMQDAMTNYTRVPMTRRERGGDPVPRYGDSSGAPTGLFPCAPGGPNDYVYVVANNPRMGAGLLKAIGREDLLDDENLRGGLRDNEGILRDAIESWTRERTKFEAMERLSECGVPSGPVMDSGDLFESEHLQARDMLVEINHPQRGTMTLFGCPIRLSESPPQNERAPLLGEHTDAVLQSELGLQQFVDTPNNVGDDRLGCVKDTTLFAFLGIVLLEEKLVEVDDRILPGGGAAKVFQYLIKLGVGVIEQFLQFAHSQFI